MTTPCSTRLSDLDAGALTGIVDLISLRELMCLMQTGNARLMSRLPPKRHFFMDDFERAPKGLNLLLRNTVTKDATHMMTRRSSSSLPYARYRMHFDVTALPTLLVTLIVPRLDLVVRIDDRSSRKPPFLPSLVRLGAGSITGPLCLISHQLEYVKVGANDIDFGAGTLDVYQELKTLRVTYASLSNADESMRSLTQWSPTKMTLFGDNLNCDIIGACRLPSSITDLRLGCLVWAPFNALDMAPLLPKSLTRLAFKSSVRVLVQGRVPPPRPVYLLQDLRTHLPNLERIIHIDDEEVFVNGRCHSFLRDLMLRAGQPLSNRDITSFMKYDKVRHCSSKPFAFSHNIGHIMYDIPALGFHLFNAVPIESALEAIQDVEQFVWTVPYMIAQLETSMFANEAHLVYRWLMLIRPAAAKGYNHLSALATCLMDMKAQPYMTRSVGPRLFRILLHLIWIASYDAKTESQFTNADTAHFLQEYFQFTDCVSSTLSTQPLIVLSLKEQLFGGPTCPNIETIERAMAMIDDEPTKVDTLSNVK